MGRVFGAFLAFAQAGIPFGCRDRWARDRTRWPDSNHRGRGCCVRRRFATYVLQPRRCDGWAQEWRLPKEPMAAQPRNWSRLRRRAVPRPSRGCRCPSSSSNARTRARSASPAGRARQRRVTPVAGLDAGLSRRRTGRTRRFAVQRVVSQAVVPVSRTGWPVGGASSPWRCFVASPRNLIISVVSVLVSIVIVRWRSSVIDRR
jgi:hypothetical protein